MQLQIVSTGSPGWLHQCHGKLWQANWLHWSTSHAWLYGCSVPEQKARWLICTTRTCSNTRQSHRSWCFSQPATTGGETYLLLTIWCYQQQHPPDCLEEEMVPFRYPDLLQISQFLLFPIIICFIQSQKCSCILQMFVKSRYHQCYLYFCAEVPKLCLKEIIIDSYWDSSMACV